MPCPAPFVNPAKRRGAWRIPSGRSTPGQYDHLPKPTDPPAVRVEKKVTAELAGFRRRLEGNEEEQQALDDVMARLGEPISLIEAGARFAESVGGELLNQLSIPERDIPDSIRNAARRASTDVLSGLPHTAPPHVAQFVRNLAAAFLKASDQQQD